MMEFDPQPDLALASLARAADAWSRSPHPPETLARLMDACSRLARADGPLWEPATLVEHLTVPIAHWPAAQPLFGTSLDWALLDANALGPEALEILDTVGDRSDLELVQERVASARRSIGALFRQDEERDERYRDFRTFLIDSPVASRREIIRALRATGLTPEDLYEPVPTAEHIEIASEIYVFPCPRCRWPMQVVGPTAGEVGCLAPSCLAEGASFRLPGSGDLAPVGGMAPPAASLLDGRLRAQRGVWRYTVLPGREELALAERIEGVGGAVRLWPSLDEFDILIEAGGRTWRVDVKDWVSPSALTRHLRKGGARSELVYVVPDRRREQLAHLRRALPAVAFLSAAELVAEVRHQLAGRTP